MFKTDEAGSGQNHCVVSQHLTSVQIIVFIIYSPSISLSQSGVVLVKHEPILSYDSFKVS